mmetsp:Transcript_11631/g.20652  ORF Transcript_11631/g.20652 Transcript_11631/m.20652 type:complete len:91 (+) Transcript_11631:569-841(+)
MVTQLVFSNDTGQSGRFRMGTDMVMKHGLMGTTSMLAVCLSMESHSQPTPTAVDTSNPGLQSAPPAATTVPQTDLSTPCHLVFPCEKNLT